MLKHGAGSHVPEDPLAAVVLQEEVLDALYRFEGRLKQVFKYYVNEQE